MGLFGAFLGFTELFLELWWGLKLFWGSMHKGYQHLFTLFLFSILPNYDDNCIQLLRCVGDGVRLWQFVTKTKWLVATGSIQLFLCHTDTQVYILLMYQFFTRTTQISSPIIFSQNICKNTCKNKQNLVTMRKSISFSWFTRFFLPDPPPPHNEIWSLYSCDRYCVHFAYCTIN